MRSLVIIVALLIFGNIVFGQLTPDAKRLFYFQERAQDGCPRCGKDRVLAAMDMATGKSSLFPTKARMRLWTFALDPTGKTLAVMGRMKSDPAQIMHLSNVDVWPGVGTSVIQFFDLETNAIVNEINTGGTYSAPIMSWSDDGGMIAVACYTNPPTLRVWDIKDKRLLFEDAHSSPGNITYLAWRRDMLAWQPYGGKIIFWQPERSGGSILPPINLEFTDLRFDWNKEGNLLAFSARSQGADRLVIYDPVKSKIVAQSRPGEFRSAIWSPDGRLVSTTSKGSICIFDKSAELVKTIPVGKFGTAAIEINWTAQGSLLRIGKDGQIQILFNSSKN